MTHFKHLLTLLLAVTCLQMSARALPNDDGDTPSITFMSGTTTLSDNLTVPNGTLIQLQANNFPEDAAFSYLIGTKSATADDFSSTKTAKKTVLSTTENPWSTSMAYPSLLLIPLRNPSC